MARNNFDDYFSEIEADAREQGPEAVRDLEAKRLRYRLVNVLLTRRQALHLTQAQLAERSGVAQTEISRIEQGRKSPNLDTYSRLASALGLEALEPRQRASA